jgi:hypothetical protein
MRIECDTEEELNRLKDKAMKCKVIALYKIGKNPLHNPTLMLKSEKNDLLKLMKEWFEKDESEIQTLFNEITCERILESRAEIENYNINPYLPGGDLEPPKLERGDV